MSTLKKWIESKRRAGASPKTVKNLERYARLWGAEGVENAHTLTSASVAAYGAARDDGTRSAAALNDERWYLGSYFRFRGLDARALLAGWPKKRQVVRKQYRTLSVEEERRVVEHLWPRDPYLAAYVTLSVCTGLRQRALLGLEWGMVRDDVLEVPGWLMKEDQPLRIPLNARALATLERLRGLEPVSDTTPILKYLGTPSEIWRAFKQALRAVGLPDNRSPHDLRKSFVERLSAAGAPIQDIARLGGWRTLSVVLNHYAGLGMERARKYVEAV